jgi:uncharacterized membrane protein YdjX (TVP38/TMEM64 family)
LLFGIVALSLTTNRWVDLEGGPRAAVQQWGIWAPLAAFAIQTITTMTPIGAVLISVANGALFDLRLAIAINLASGVVGGLGMYFVWRRGDHEFDIQARMKHLPQWFRRHAGDNLLFLTALRLFPWAGGSLADLIAGSHRIRIRTQFLSLLIGYFPGSVAYALIGAGVVYGL